MHPLLNIAINAARQAGKVITQNSYRIERVRFDEKGKHDYVSEIDQQAEAEIVEIIQKAYPQHSIIAEEGTRFDGNEFEWIIDPLDGTTNYLHSVPQYAVSIAVRKAGELAHAVVLDPVLGELFTASRGDGAHLNNRRIRASKVFRLDQCLIGTGFPFRELDNIEQWVDVFRELAKSTSGIRRPGAAAIDLAYVAAGRYDGFWESGLSQWDTAAGALLIKEAGGLISDFEGGTDYLDTGRVVASTPAIHDDLLRIVQNSMKKTRK